MTEAVGSLNQGEEYSLKSVADAFLDHIDRAREALRNSREHRAFPCIRISNSELPYPKGSEPDSDSSGPLPLLASSSDDEREKARKAQSKKSYEPDSDSSEPWWPLVKSPETSEDEYWERTRRESKHLEARHSAKIAKQQK